MFKSQVQYAHMLIKEFLSSQDHVVDATCGNGGDSLFIASLINEGRAYSLDCIDIQSQALENTKQRLTQSYGPELLKRCSFIKACHTKAMPSHPPSLVIFNLGYLPGSDKTISTHSATTLDSISHFLEQLTERGYISVMAYTGHDEGAKEAIALKEFCASLDKNRYSCLQTEKLNAHKAPLHFFIGKTPR